MFGKKKDVRTTMEQIREMEVLDEINHLTATLRYRAKTAYFRSMALNCYLPDSPDYKKACEELREAQELVRNTIAAYDDKKAEIIRNHPNLSIKIRATSHEIIEYAMRDINR